MRLTDSLHKLHGSFSSLAHARELLVLPALLLMSVTSINCTEEPSSNGTSSSSSSSGEGGAGGDGGTAGAGGMGGAGGMAPQSVVGTFGLFDAQTSAAVEGAPVTFGAEMQTTNAEGDASFNLLPGSPYEIIASPTQYLPIHFFGITGNANFSTARGLFSEMTISQLSGALGETYDPTKAIVSVIAVGPDLNFLAESLQVDTTATYGFAAVTDSSSPVGFSKGNASLAGNESQVFLINVDPGPVPLTVMLQMAKSCTVYPSSMAQGSENVIAYAHEVSTLSFVCQ